MKMGVLALLLVVMLLLGALTSLAETTLDFSTMNVEALISLRAQIDAEIRERLTLEESTIYSGVYVVGVDILPGEYTITPIEVNSTWMRCFLYEDEKAMERRQPINMGDGNPPYSEVGEPLFLTLKENMILTIDDGYGIIMPVSPNWKP